MLNRTDKQDTSRRENFYRRLRCALALLTAGAMAAFSAVCPAQDIGTVFTTPEERDYLDYLRQDFVTRSQLATFNIQEDVIPDIPEVDESETEAEVEVTEYHFGGIMTRRNGGRMVWLNGKQTAERDLPSNISLVDAEEGILLSVRLEGNTYRLKPGESFATTSGGDEESSGSGDNAAAGDASPGEPTAGAGADPSTSDTTRIALGEALRQLNADGEGQLQEALDTLTEQAEAEQ